MHPVYRRRIGVSYCSLLHTPLYRCFLFRIGSSDRVAASFLPLLLLPLLIFSLLSFIPHPPLPSHSLLPPLFLFNFALSSFATSSASLYLCPLPSNSTFSSSSFSFSTSFSFSFFLLFLFLLLQLPHLIPHPSSLN